MATSKHVLCFAPSKCFRKRGILHTVEDPESSALWWLEQWGKIPHAVFDQCMLGLAPPDPHLVETHRVQKKTRLARTVVGIDLFSKFKCDRSHPHSVVIGLVGLNDRRINVGLMSCRGKSN